jgi:hypothetical protein
MGLMATQIQDLVLDDQVFLPIQVKSGYYYAFPSIGAVFAPLWCYMVPPGTYTTVDEIL